jgi:hypothetical protein
MRGLISILVLVVSTVIVCMNTPLSAQQRASAGIYGSVLDSQGAIVPGAKVTLLQVSTNQLRTTTTDPTGEFLFALLPVGEYRITVEQAGFKKYEQTGLLLQVNDNIRADVRLEVGDVSTAVTVEAAGVNVEVANATITDNVIGHDTFGQISNTDGDPRILQFSLKVEF